MKMIKCLLVDDDPDEFEIFQAAIDDTLLPVECLYASNCPYAIDHVQGREQQIPEFVFIDWLLPAMDGMQCLTNLKMLPELSGAEFVIYTAFALSESTMKAIESYHCKFLRKSESVTMLSDQLRSILQPVGLTQVNARL